MSDYSHREGATASSRAPLGVPDADVSWLRLKHPKECLPFRPATKPSWEPRRTCPDARKLSDVASDVRLNPELSAASDLGPVRINFRYASYPNCSTSFSEKAGRHQYFESSHEAHGFKRHEVDPFYIDLQYQPLMLSWQTRAGRKQWMIFDYAVETEDGDIIVGEDKASKAYFDSEDAQSRFAFAESYLASIGVRFERRIKGGATRPYDHSVIKELFDNRRTAFTPKDEALIRELVESSGGKTDLRAVFAAWGTSWNEGIKKIGAMLQKRLITMPLNFPPMPYTQVSIPKAAQPKALRAFLQQYASPDNISTELH